MDSDYVTNCRKELVVNTVGIERGADIVVRGGKYVMFIGKKLLPVMKDKEEELGLSFTRSGGSRRRSGSLCSPHA
ncbi:hypothetical protein PV726_49555 [Streptomyces europaeiscabiei]|uniref:hypothetical protein n=1 Tax=Streptomyces europaeiscabiei TaxID=146819 RepID=UPI00299F9271|nr:hypothetical protein [Streptomyces europaeiscabiei]MDX3698053.1 hypothetical protein [Streptomyces europaeiscabiei]